MSKADHTSNDLIRILSKYDTASVFSFDVFDTLIERLPGKPEILFDCIEERACRENISAKGFRSMRIKAELKARERCEGEISFKDIYDNLETYFSKEALEKLRDMEELAELDLTVPINATTEAIDWLLSHERTVVLTSDMYHSREFIENILDKNGIRGYKNLFLSSEIGKRKSTGSLFKYLCKSLSVSPEKVVHIGDNPISDIQIPRKMGIQTVQIKKGLVVREPIAFYRIKRKYFKKSKKNTWWDLSPFENLNSFEKLGFSILGPLLFGFSHWLHNKVRDKGINKLLFMSRDGLLLKNAYDQLFPKDTSVYMFGSRRAIIVPSLWEDASLETVLKSLPLGSKITLNSFLERLGLSFQAVLDSAFRFRYESTSVLDTSTILQNERFVSFYSSIESLILANSRKEHELYVKYLKSIIKSDDKCAFIDIGWNGYMQKAFSDILFTEFPGISVEGFYTGLRPQSPLSSQTRYLMNGFLFCREWNEEASSREELYNALYEVMFSANHGTVVSFCENETGVVEPLFLNNERDGMQQGIVSDIQKGALAYVHEAKRHNLAFYKDYSPKSLLTALDRIGLNPTLQEAKELGDICIYEYGKRKLVHLRHPKDYFKNPSSLVKDFAMGYWKPGFLKATLRLPIPYGNMLAKFKQISRKRGTVQR